MITINIHHINCGCVPRPLHMYLDLELRVAVAESLIKQNDVNLKVFREAIPGATSMSAN